MRLVNAYIVTLALQHENTIVTDTSIVLSETDDLDLILPKLMQYVNPVYEIVCKSIVLIEDAVLDKLANHAIEYGIWQP